MRERESPSVLFPRGAARRIRLSAPGTDHYAPRVTRRVVYTRERIARTAVPSRAENNWRCVLLRRRLLPPPSLSFFLSDFLRARARARELLSLRERYRTLATSMFLHIIIIIIDITSDMDAVGFRRLLNFAEMPRRRIASSSSRSTS